MSVNPSQTYLLDFFQRSALIATYPKAGTTLCAAQASAGIVSQLSSESGFSAQVLARLNNRGLTSVTRKVGDFTSRRLVSDTGVQEALAARNRNMSHLARVCPTPLFGSRDTFDPLLLS